MKTFSLIYAFVFFLMYSLVACPFYYQHIPVISDDKFEINDILPFITLIVSILNFIFIIYVFKSNQKEIKARQAREEHFFWFKNFILTPNFDKIKKYFEDSSKLLEKTIKEIFKKKNNNEAFNKIAEETIKHIKESRTNISVGFLDNLMVIDNHFSEIISDFFDEHESKLVNFINIAGHQEGDLDTILINVDREIRRVNNKVLKYLYKYQSTT